ncbi:MAG TPA: hypothetical protein VIQ54_06725 [Polyangia bacterium]
MSRIGVRLALAAALAGAPACIPYVLPPGQAEFGFARDGRWGQGTMVHLAAGIHSASVPQLIAKPIDLGVGYGADLFGAQHNRTSEVRVHGPYAEGSWFVFRRPWFRVSAGLRGEMLIKSGDLGWDVLARSSAEIFKVGYGVPSGADLCSIHGGSGALAMGVYAESGYQQLPWGGHAYITTAGFTFRWPFMYGVLVYGCPGT